MQPVVDLMIDYLARPVVHEAFFKKYASKKFLKGTCQKTSPLLLHFIVADAPCSLHPGSPMGQEERGAVWHYRY